MGGSHLQRPAGPRSTPSPGAACPFARSDVASSRDPAPPQPWSGLSRRPLGHRFLQGPRSTPALARPGPSPTRTSLPPGCPPCCPSLWPPGAPGDPAPLSLNPWAGDWVSALAEGPALMADTRRGLGNVCRGMHCAAPVQGLSQLLGGGPGSCAVPTRGPPGQPAA